MNNNSVSNQELVNKYFELIDLLISRIQDEYKVEFNKIKYLKDEFTHLNSSPAFIKYSFNRINVIKFENEYESFLSNKLNYLNSFIGQLETIRDLVPLKIESEPDLLQIYIDIKLIATLITIDQNFDNNEIAKVLEEADKMSQFLGE